MIAFFAYIAGLLTLPALFGGLVLWDWLRSERPSAEPVDSCPVCGSVHSEEHELWH